MSQKDWKPLSSLQMETCDRRSTIFRCDFHSSVSKISRFCYHLQATCRCRSLESTSISWLKFSEPLALLSSILMRLFSRNSESRITWPLLLSRQLMCTYTQYRDLKRYLLFIICRHALTLHISSCSQHLVALDWSTKTMSSKCAISHIRFLSRRLSAAVSNSRLMMLMMGWRWGTVLKNSIIKVF